jgi:UDP-N-acetylglucosamine 1-carboxyvinyltransferase
MARFVIHGGRRLAGTHRTPGNKNAALPMLPACLLTDEPIVLQNVPLIDDVRTMLGILDHLGVSVDVKGHTVTLCAGRLRRTRLPPDLCGRVRSSILFAGPMLARLGRVTLFPPGGDVIGRRRLDTHFEGLRQLGVTISGHHSYSLRQRGLRAEHSVLDETSVTATENVLMAATLTRGTTTLFNAACEPHVQDLCRLLRKMGARIAGIGTNLLRIEGVDALHGARHRVSPDHIDAASFLAAAALTGGQLRIEDAPAAETLAVLARPFQKLNAGWAADPGGVTLPAGQALRVRNDFGAAIPKIEDGVWPAFPSDLMSVMIVMATQAKGAVLFFEKMFESRMYFVDRLIEMGARIVQCDPHRVIVAGPARLHGTHLSGPDIRAGMALLLAALCARGESVIDNAQIIDRGYEEVDRELRRLGADIERQA